MMIHPASKEYYFAPMAFLKALFIIMAFMLPKLTLVGQETLDYRGAWQIETPENNTLVLIVKRNNLASYFWANNSDQTVYKGSWSSDANGATLQWEDGSSHRITRDRLTGYEVTHSDALRQILYKTAAVRFPEKVLGQWAKAPPGPEDDFSDRDRARGFFGTWEIGSDSNLYYLVIEPDRSAATNRTQGNLDDSGMRGSWAKQGSELHVACDTGHYGILKQNERNFTFRLIVPGEFIEENESNERVATRISEERLPAEWRNSYTDEKQAQKTVGAAFTDRRDATSFYRGSWIIQRSEDTFERIEVGRFGGLKTSADSTLYGNWRMAGQNIFMNWDDGMRNILRSVGNGFLLYEYKPGRPIDGVPTRIFSATPEDARKLAEHMGGRKAIASKLLSLAEEAGATADMTGAGWGKTFMRRAWPFGGQSEEDSPDALLENRFALSPNANPWWWPFWSEIPVSDMAETQTERNKVEIIINSESAKADANQTASNEKTAPSQKSDWEWPF